MADIPHLSVIIPAYNEEPNFKKGALDQVSKYLSKQQYLWEVLVVDDGSEDSTAALCTDFARKHNNFRVIKNPHQGKAETLKTRVRRAKREKEPIYRHLMGLVFNLLVQAIAVRGIWDTQAGFKCFKKDVAKILFEKLKVYGKGKKVKGALVTAFDVELLFIAKKRNYKIKEVPIVWHHEETTRVSPIKDSLRMLRDVLRIRLNDLRGVYR